MAYKIIKKANNEKYRQVLKHIRECKGIAKDEFPKTMVNAVNTLNTYKNTQVNNRNGNQLRSNNNNNKNNNDEVKHENKNKTPKLRFMVLEGRCYCCGKKGHKLTQY